MLPNRYRLKKRTAFKATYKTGNSYRQGGIILFCGRKKADADTKIGFVVSKKIHKRAVKRNRIKRLMRESVRLYIKSLGDNFKSKYMSLVFVATAGLLEKDFNYVNDNIKKLLEKIND